MATALFECSVDDLDSVLEEKNVNVNDNRYFTKADVDRLIEILEQYKSSGLLGL